MKIIAGALNGEHLRGILLSAPDEVEWVRAAIAYASGTPELLEFCIDRKLRFEFWGRIDETIPISINLLERLNKLGPNFTTKLVLRHYHPKIIWFGGYGVYIGSANLTDNGWYKNIECGIFLSEADLVSENLMTQIHDIFRDIDSKAVPLTSEIIQQLKELQERHGCHSADLKKAEKERLNDFEDLLGPVIPKKFNGLSVVSKKSATENSKQRFLEEWNETLQLIRQISDQISLDQNRPNWISPSVSKGVQVDQFLHWYYYQHVKKSNRSHHSEMYLQNQARPEAALKEAMQLWKGLKEAPTSEKTMIEDHAPVLKQQLAQGRISKLSEDEWVSLCEMVNAFHAASRQTKNIVIGLPANTQLQRLERVGVVARWIYHQKSANDSSILTVLRFVLYGGPSHETSDRIWRAAFTDEWHIPQFGLSCIGEFVGWALPDAFPPRNGRTSKALNALGFNVTVHSE